jgi:hypothetical protein
VKKQCFVPTELYSEQLLGAPQGASALRKFEQDFYLPRWSTTIMSLFCPANPEIIGVKVHTDKQTDRQTDKILTQFTCTGEFFLV